MLIARAPVRISFGGGGTDLPAYYEQYEGMVVSAAINKYFYTVVSPTTQQSGIQIISSDYRTFFRHDPERPFFWNGNGTLPLPKAVLHHFGVDRGYDLFLSSEIPPGTGLGSSGSVAVTLVRAISALCGHALSQEQIAETACYIEIDKMGMPVGKQDQYAAAFGGLNTITFQPDRVTVEPLRTQRETVHELSNHLMLFFTGSTRESSKILSHQKRASEKNEDTVIASLHALKRVAEDMRQCLEQSNLDAFGELMHYAWQRKKQLAPNISNTDIDRYYEISREYGAIGGKITGAGGGGFLMLYCPPIHQRVVTRALEAEGLVRMDFDFDFQGATVLLDTLSRGHAWRDQEPVMELVR